MARSKRVVRDVVLVSVLTAVGAVGLVAGVAGVRLLAARGVELKATVEVEGRVVDGFRPTDEKALVVWSTEEGDEQSTWFALDEPGRWAPGQAFRVRYDPQEGSDKGPFLPKALRDKVDVVSGEPDAHNADHDAGWDYWWPTAAIGGVAALVLLAWAARLRLNQVAAAAPPVPMRVVAVRGRSSALGTKDSVALLLAPPDAPLDTDALSGLDPLPRELPGLLWQRVYWHPAVETITPGATVRARIKDGFGRRAVVELDGDVLTQPAGRLRATAHRGISYTVPEPRAYARYAVSQRPPPVVWLVPIPAGLFSAARGHFLADAPLIILGLLVLTTFAWAWFTPAPEA
ncbi:hypothetical protein ACFFQW_43540 [Umezawaea endophytica]|uniref:hypothetical protein n=1 Tax=Umezawaea endophytica TaxID=1654476 RepID=UPI0023DE8E86|nr:hypothetical protein [Umezawaea endophytica]